MTAPVSTPPTLVEDLGQPIARSSVPGSNPIHRIRSGASGADGCYEIADLSANVVRIGAAGGVFYIWENGSVVWSATDLATMGSFGITTTGDQAAALNAALVTMAAGGQKVLHLTGNITVNSLITLQSGVSIALDGWAITWGGGATPMFTSAASGVLQKVRISGGVIDCATASKMFNLASPYHVRFADLIVTSNSSTNFLFDLSVNPSGTTNADGNWNAAYVDFDSVLQTGTCGTLYRGTGNSSSQVVTLISFNNVSGVSCAVKGWDHVQWTDTINFSGVCRVAIPNDNGIGMECNSGAPGSDVGVYNININKGAFAVDCFGVKVGRIGLKIGFADQSNYDLFNDPAAEGGQYTVTANSGYTIRRNIPSTNTTIVEMDQATALKVAQGARAGYILGKSGTPVTAPLDTSNDTLATITLPAGAMGLNGQIKVSALFNAASATTNRTLTINFGATAVVSKILTNEVDMLLEGVIANTNSASAQHCTPTFTSINGIALLAPTTAAIDTTAAVSITLKCQKATGADPLILKRYTVELLSDGT